MKQLGCFGMPSTHDPGSDVCRACEAFDPCGKVARKVLEALRGRIVADRMVNALTLPHTPKPALPIATRVNSAPAKVQPRLQRLIENGFDRIAQDALRRGENPFPATRSKTLHQAAHVLLTRGSYVKANLSDWVVLNLLWSPAAARSQVSNDLALLKGLELVEEDEQGRVVLHRHARKAEITT